MGENWEAPQVQGICEDGTAVELDAFTVENQMYPGLTDRDWASKTITHHVDGGGSYEGIYSIQMFSGNMFTLTEFLPDVGISTEHHGYWYCMGMSEAGIATGYGFFEDGDGLEAGVLLLKRSDPENMFVTEANGPKLFDVPRAAPSALAGVADKPFWGSPGQ